MFFINRIKLEIVRYKNLLQQLKMWFNIAPNEYISNPTLLDPYPKKSNTLEIEKISTFVFNFFHNPVQESKSHSYHSTKVFNLSFD